EETRLAVILASIGALGYDGAEHERVRREMAELRGFEALAGEVAAAAARLPAAREQLCQTAELLGGKREALCALGERVAQLETEVARAAEVDGLVAQASAA